MERVLIIGAGGWGREVLHQMTHDDAGNGVHWQVAGFLDNRAHVLDDYDTEFPILGDPLNYEPQTDDVFVCALGDPRQREKYTRPLLARGARFIPVSTQSFLGSRVHLGHGSLLGHWVHSGPDTWIGDFANIQTLSVLGHDVHIGNYAHVGAQVFMGGGVHIGDFAIVHPRATIIAGVKVGNEAVVGAGAVVIHDVAAGDTVFGNPAKVIFHKHA